MEPNYKNLLDQVSAIAKRYEKINELTGENFNVFKILKLESSEVRMHSAFIAELLNPKGSHGQKDTFLQLFMNLFCFKGNSIDIENCNVHVEKHIGFINEDETEGGRIDIFIDDRKGNHIIIENKIYAEDQRNQLLRYYRHFPNADLIYLTLFGTEPSEESRGGLEMDYHYKCFSYSKHITKWLEDCRKEVSVLPILRESITQYIHLIKSLTNQTINDTMKEELSAIILTNLEASFIIADNIDNSLLKLINKLQHELEGFANDIELKFSFNISKEFKKNYSGFWFWNSKWKYVTIGFQFQQYDKKLIWGIQTKCNPLTTPIPDEVRKSLTSLSKENFKTNNWWPINCELGEPYDNWGKYGAWKAIENGEMIEIVKEKVTYLLGLVKDLKL